MAYSHFTLVEVESKLGVSTHRRKLFDSVPNLEVPTWLTEMLERGSYYSQVSEKSRSELIVMPILLACREITPGPLSILSGIRLDVKPDWNLLGECDFILSKTEPIPELRAPLMVVVEAKKNDLEAGLGQCVAQMVASRIFNREAGATVPVIYGCVTTGQDWQFIRLVGSDAEIDRTYYYLNDVGRILGVFQKILQS